jgi:hypothetical protein
LLVSCPGSPLFPIHRALFKLFYRAFEVTNEIECLNKAISAARDHINTKTTDSLIGRLISLSHLELSLSTRLELLNLGEDLNGFMEVHAMPTEYKNTDYFRR